VELVSWGLMRTQAPALAPRNRFEAEGLAALGQGARFAIHAAGRSYSDVALPREGAFAVATSGLGHVVSFDRKLGIVSAEAGVTLRAIQELALPWGWGLPVLPGTAWATLGGALANDVHGKNHGSRGAFSRCVKSVRMVRSDRGVFVLDRSEEALWRATVGGLGATGLMTALTIQLEPWAGSQVAFEQRRFVGIEQFMRLSQHPAEFVVGWIDAFSNPPRGIVFMGERRAGLEEPRAGGSLSWPLPPAKVISTPFSKAFNQAYWASHRDGGGKVADWLSFFCPLDGVGNWNRLYGRGGFSQFQCVVPAPDAPSVLGEMFKMCREAGLGSFLSVIKKFGSLPSEGVLSFAREGVTFAMDFPNQAGTGALLQKLGHVALAAGGALYPAKTCFGRAEMEASFPRWREWREQWDAEAGSSSEWIKRATK
jgi:FAD/FMN-containing dehydrogenase